MQSFITLVLLICLLITTSMTTIGNVADVVRGVCVVSICLLIYFIWK